MLKTASRDNARQPMQWKKEGGFTTGISWLKMNENKSHINVEDNLKNTDSILRHYQELIRLRRTHEVLIDGSFKPLYMKHNVFIFERNLGEKTLITVSNMSKKIRKLPKSIQGSILLSNMHRTTLSNASLMPYESILIDKEKRS
jgi:glycosidase